MSADQIAEQFLNHYYGTFSSNRPALQSLYQQDSTLTFEGEQYTGTQAIAGKFAALPFQQIQFQVVTKDIQMGINQNCLLIFVNGTLRIDNEANNLKFSQSSNLLAPVAQFTLGTICFESTLVEHHRNHHIARMCNFSDAPS